MPSPPLNPLFSSLNITLGCYLNTYEETKFVYQIISGAFWTSKKRVQPKIIKNLPKITFHQEKIVPP